MANKKLFKSTSGTQLRSTGSYKNAAGGRAYKLEDAEALCQYVVTTTFSDVFYANAQSQVSKMLEVCANVEPTIIAKAAVYGHESGHMKDAPAFLLAYLASVGELDLLRKVFPRVVTTPKMLLNFVQILRSGVTGRKSMGTAVKRLVQDYLTSKTGNQLFRASIGKSNPSLAYVIKIAHPKAKNKEQDALFAYLLGAKISNKYPYTVSYMDKKFPFSNLPSLVQEFEWFKYDNSYDMPDLNFTALTNCNLTVDHWRQIARNMPWNTLRLNLNLLNRNGVFNDDSMVEYVAQKLSDKEEVRKWNVFPYQILTSYLYANDVPQAVRNSLQKAMEHATYNVPKLGKRVGIAVDVSGSMSSSITGNSSGKPSIVTCKQVAALIAASLLRTNDNATLVSFGTNARVVKNANPYDSVATLTNRLEQESRYVGHGTCAQAAMDVFNEVGKFDMIVYVSDCQSWVDSSSYMFKRSYETCSPLMASWKKQQRNNSGAKLAEINVQPYGDSQADSKDRSILNVGGFSDSVFDVLAEFASRKDNVTFLSIVDKVQL